MGTPRTVTRINE